MVERAAHSVERSRTCCSVGTSPVRRSQKRPRVAISNEKLELLRILVKADLQEEVLLRREPWARFPGIRESVGIRLGCLK